MITRLEFTENGKTYSISRNSCFDCRYSLKENGIECDKKSLCENIAGFVYTAKHLEKKVIYKAVPEYFKKQIIIKTVEIEQLDNTTFRILEDHTNKIFHGSIEGIGDLEFSLGQSIDACVLNIRSKLEREIRILEDQTRYHKSFLDREKYDIVITDSKKSIE